MKIPRDITGLQLSHLLLRFGYVITRQTGSHIRLTTYEKGQHHLTIPSHNPLKIGTLSGILLEVSSHLECSKEQLVQDLFYKC